MDPDASYAELQLSASLFLPLSIAFDLSTEYLVPLLICFSGTHGSLQESGCISRAGGVNSTLATTGTVMNNWYRRRSLNKQLHVRVLRMQPA